MPDIPNTRFFNLVDKPVTVIYDSGGVAVVPLDPQTAEIVDITEFRIASLQIGQTSATSFEMDIGKLSGATLAQPSTQPIDQQIHVFDVVGPEMRLILQGGPPDSKEEVQLWVYLRS